MTENLLNLKKEADIQVLEAQKVPIKMNSNIHISRHISIEMAKVKERILKEAR